MLCQEIMVSCQVIMVFCQEIGHVNPGYKITGLKLCA